MTIVAAAIKFGDVICFVPQPGRHHNILGGLHKNHGKRTTGYDTEVQGFFTDAGEFLNRREAYDHCLRTGQGLPRRESLLAGGNRVYDGEELYSEDLW